MKKIAYVGDIHGKSDWQHLLSAEAPVDHTVFLGDYLDSFDASLTPLIQADNLQYILEIKKASPDKVTLLVGNHDLQYFDPTIPQYRCSGFNKGGSFMYSDILRSHRDLFQMAHLEEGRLATHAGVTDWWLLAWKHANGFKGNESIEEYLVNPMNDYFQEDHRKAMDLMALVGSARGGFNHTGGPLWADRKELIASPMMGTDQVVGHTYVSMPYAHYTQNNDRIYFCDTGLEELLVFQDVTYEHVAKTPQLG